MNHKTYNPWIKKFRIPFCEWNFRAFLNASKFIVENFMATVIIELTHVVAQYLHVVKTSVVLNVIAGLIILKSSLQRDV